MRTAALAASTVARRGHRRQRDADHAGAVLAADGQHGHDGDDRLAEVDPGQADLGGVFGAVPGRAPDGRAPPRRPPPRSATTAASSSQPVPGSVRAFVHSACSASRMARPTCSRASAEVSPLRGRGLGHASLRCSRYPARPSARAAQRQSTAKPAHGASGKYPFARRVAGVELRVPRVTLLDGEARCRGDPQQPVRGAGGQHGQRPGEEVRQHDQPR